MLPLNIGIDHVNNRLVIINIPHLNLDLIQPGPLCGMEPPVPTDDLIPALCAAAHGQVGKDTVLPDAVHQLLHILIVTHLKRMPDERMAARESGTSVTKSPLSRCLSASEENISSIEGIFIAFRNLFFAAIAGYLLRKFNIGLCTVAFRVVQNRRLCIGLALLHLHVSGNLRCENVNLIAVGAADLPAVVVGDVRVLGHRQQDALHAQSRG